jgi:hypothetical protein
MINFAYTNKGLYTVERDKHDSRTLIYFRFHKRYCDDYDDIQTLIISLDYFTVLVVYRTIKDSSFPLIVGVAVKAQRNQQVFELVTFSSEYILSFFVVVTSA